MHYLVQEFQDLVKRYQDLGKELSGVLEGTDSGNPQVLVQSILQNRDCLSRIIQIDVQVQQLSGDWQKTAPQLDSNMRLQVRALADAAKAQAVRLKGLCGAYAEKIENARGQLGKELAEIGRGSQYLQSVKPIKGNYPKFIDSVY